MPEDYLSDEEIAHIEAFMSNEKMHEAVRKVLLQGIYTHGVLKPGQKHDPLKNGALSLAALSTENPIPDEILGQNIRAQWAGLNALESAFKKLGTIKSKKAEDPNPPQNEGV